MKVLKMNVPNFLSLLRLAMVPVFAVVFFQPIPPARSGAVGVDALAFVTDIADGYIARHFNQITRLGRILDPLADKLLVCSALICLIELGQLPAWVVIIIISREFIISGFRLVAADNGIVIAASYWGKFKTVFQMTAVILLIFNIPSLALLTNIVLAVAVVLTVVSLADYIVKNRKVLTEGGM